MALLAPSPGGKMLLGGDSGALCSRILRQPRGAPPAPAPAMVAFGPSHDREAWRVHTTPSDGGNATQGPRAVRITEWYPLVVCGRRTAGGAEGH